MVDRSERRQLLVGRGCIQAVLLVMLCGFFILGLLAYRTYMAHPPVPRVVTDPQGRILFTGTDAVVTPAVRRHGTEATMRAVARRFGTGTLIALAVLVASGAAMASHFGR